MDSAQILRSMMATVTWTEISNQSIIINEQLLYVRFGFVFKHLFTNLKMNNADRSLALQESAF